MHLAAAYLLLSLRGFMEGRVLQCRHCWHFEQGSSSLWGLLCVL